MRIIKQLGILGFVLLVTGILHAGEARLQVLRLDSQILKDNPLHDPSRRSVALFIPAQATNDNQRLPIIYYLPGYGSSSEKFITGSNTWLKFTQQIADEIRPMILVVVDGRTRWGGSQYLDSTAQGNYETYICDEIVTAVETRFAAPTNGIRRIIAGHSSGGFGALRLGMSHHQLFDGVIALSPDADFKVTQMPLVKIAAVTNVSLAEIERMANGQAPAPRNGDLLYALGMSAAYAPRGKSQPGAFDWIFDAHGKYRTDVEQRWLDNDPLLLVQRNPQAFDTRQKVYLDGAAQDEYSANIGAESVFDALTNRPVADAFYQPPGHHSDHLQGRIDRGLEWIFGQSLREVK